MNFFTGAPVSWDMAARAEARRAARLSRCAVAAIGVVLALAATTAQARRGPQADSLLAALHAADVTVRGRVVDVRKVEGALIADVEVAEILSGKSVGERLRVRSTLAETGRMRPMECYLEPGERVLLLLVRSGDAYTCPSTSRQGRIPLADDPAVASASVELLRGYLTAIATHGPGSAEFKAFLVQHLTTPNPQLRAGVRVDLASRLDGGDARFLTVLLADSSASEELRVWAVYSLIELRPPSYPDELLDLLDPSQSVALREAALLAYGARSDPADLPILRRGLDDPAPQVRRLAVEKLGMPEAVPVLREHFDREAAPGVRLAIVSVLGVNAEPGADDALRSILASSEDPAIRQAARMWLAAIEERAGDR